MNFTLLSWDIKLNKKWRVFKTRSSEELLQDTVCGHRMHYRYSSGVRESDLQCGIQTCLEDWVVRV